MHPSPAPLYIPGNVPLRGQRGRPGRQRRKKSKRREEKTTAATRCLSELRTLRFIFWFISFFSYLSLARHTSIHASNSGCLKYLNKKKKLKEESC